MKSKYIVLAIALLLTLSSTASVVRATPPLGSIIPATQVDTHGPRISQIDFSVVSADSSLASSLASGTIDGPEWTFSAGSYASLAYAPNVKEAKTTGYTFEGIVFNDVQGIINNTNFRRAIAYLTNYGFIQATILQGIAGVATPYLLPCSLAGVPAYPETASGVSCVANQNAIPTYPFNLEKAAIDLAASGLYVTGNTTDITLANILLLPTQIGNLAWYTCTAVTEGVYVGGSPAWETCLAAGPSAWTVFNPSLYYRIDDPLRTAYGTAMALFGTYIGLQLNAQPITDSEADSEIYGNAGGPIMQTGGYCDAQNIGTYPGAHLGYNQCPVAEVNMGAAAVAADPWDMYTYGWVASDLPVFQGFYWTNTQFLAYGADTGNLVNQSMDYNENLVYYASTLKISEQAALGVLKSIAQVVPDIVGYYENYLYAGYINGWSGYAGEPTVGSFTTAGAYYTMLNVHPYSASNPMGLGGIWKYAVHAPASTTGLSPIYGTNWVWQADLWSELYDAPLGTGPTQLQTPGAFIPWMVSGKTLPTSTYGTGIGYSSGVQVATFTKAQTGIGSGISNIPSNAYCIQNVTPGFSHCDLTIPNGEAVTYTFDSNMTWSDGVPITAYDYNYSLYALDVAYTPALGSVCVVTPYYGADSGPLGLLATTVQTLPNGQTSITMYMGDQAYWNVLDLDVVVIPQHIFQNLDIANAFVYHANVDLAQTAANACAANSAMFNAACASLPAYLTALPALEVSSGPFYLGPFNEGAGSGVMYANLNYYRSAWYDGLPNPANTYAPTATVTFNVVPVQIGGTDTNPDLSAGSITTTTMIPANGASAFTCTVTLQKYSGAIPTTNIYSGVALGAKITVPSGDISGCGTSSPITISFTPSALGLTANFNYKVTVVIDYTYLTLARVWYQYYGIHVS